MNDDDRRELAEAMGEEWHENSRAALFHLQASCSCGLSFEDNWTLATHIKDINRTFTTWTDFGDVWQSEKIFPEGHAMFLLWLYKNLQVETAQGLAIVWAWWEEKSPAERCELILQWWRER